MHTLTKSHLTTTLLATPALDADAPSTQPATQPIIAQSNAPLVIPDGTSPQNPGPQFQPSLQSINFNGPNADFNQSFVITGVRG